MQRGAGLPLVAPWRGEREREREVWRVGCSHGVLTRAERWERRGSHVGRTVVAWAGVVGGGALGGNTRWWRQVAKAEGEQN